MAVTVHRPPRAPLPEDLARRWRRIPVPVAVDIAPERQIDPSIRPLLPVGRQLPLFGRAVTARCEPPDFGAALMALETASPGDVLVIDAGGYAGAAMIGDILGGHLHRKGAVGIVCDGAVRDVAGLAALSGFSVYARFVNPRGPTGAVAGEVDGPVTIGGCPVMPGDLVIGDDDGAVALPVDRLATLIDRAEAKLAVEAVWTSRLAAGDRIADVFDL